MPRLMPWATVALVIGLALAGVVGGVMAYAMANPSKAGYGRTPGRRSLVAGVVAGALALALVLALAAVLYHFAWVDYRRGGPT